MSEEKPDEIIAIFQKATAFARDLMHENERLRSQLGTVTQHTDRVAERYAQIAEQTDLLRNLFVATHRLHATLDHEEVVSTIREILSDLVGAHAYLIWLADRQRGGQIKLLTHSGVAANQLQLSAKEVELAPNVIAGEPWYAEKDAPRGELPLAMLPLSVGNTPAGLLVIRDLHSHKSDLLGLDRQVLEMLSGQAAIALSCARLYAEQPEPAVAKLA
jgi:K+-sensing histidine kinase KdpD